MIVSRKRWGAAKPKRKGVARPVHDLDGVVVHWFGVPSAITAPYTLAKEAAQLRSVQAYHLKHPTENYRDIAYNQAVGQSGRIYNLRGFRYQSGANGDSVANRDYNAIVAMIGKGDTPTKKLLDSLAWLIGEYRRKGAGCSVLDHHSITGTTCPGPDLRAWIKKRLYENQGRKAP